MGLVIGRAKEGEEGQLQTRGGSKQVAGKQEGADNFELKTSNPEKFCQRGLKC